MADLYVGGSTDGYVGEGQVGSPSTLATPEESSDGWFAGVMNCFVPIAISLAAVSSAYARQAQWVGSQPQDELVVQTPANQGGGSQTLWVVDPEINVPAPWKWDQQNELPTAPALAGDEGAYIPPPPAQRQYTVWVGISGGYSAPAVVTVPGDEGAYQVPPPISKLVAIDPWAYDQPEDVPIAGDEGSFIPSVVQNPIVSAITYVQDEIARIAGDEGEYIPSVRLPEIIQLPLFAQDELGTPPATIVDDSDWQVPVPVPSPILSAIIYPQDEYFPMVAVDEGAYIPSAPLQPVIQPVNPSVGDELSFVVVVDEDGYIPTPPALEAPKSAIVYWQDELTVVGVFGQEDFPFGPMMFVGPETQIQLPPAGGFGNPPAEAAGVPDDDSGNFILRLLNQRPIEADPVIYIDGSESLPVALDDSYYLPQMVVDNKIKSAIVYWQDELTVVANFGTDEVGFSPRVFPKPPYILEVHGPSGGFGGLPVVTVPGDEGTYFQPSPVLPAPKMATLYPQDERAPISTLTLDDSGYAPRVPTKAPYTVSYSAPAAGYSTNIPPLFIDEGVWPFPVPFWPKPIQLQYWMWDDNKYLEFVPPGPDAIIIGDEDPCALDVDVETIPGVTYIDETILSTTVSAEPTPGDSGITVESAPTTLGETTEVIPSTTFSDIEACCKLHLEE